MKLTCNVEVEDFVAFNMHRVANSKASIASYRRYSMLTPIAFVILSLWYFLKEDYIGVVVYVLLAGLAYLIYPKFVKWTNRRHFRRFAIETMSDVCGKPQSVELCEDGVIVETALGSSTLNYSAIDRIVSHGVYQFIYIGNGGALFLPNDRIPQEQIDKFVAELKK